MSNHEFDVVVIGSGSGGGFAAMALAEAGFRVLVLERGKRYVPSRDFPMNHMDWELRPDPLRRSASEPSLLINVGEPVQPGFEHLCSGTATRKSACATRASFHYQRAIGLGGSTLHYQGEAHRFAPYAIRSASEYGLGVDWPIDYDELTPHYEQAERILGVAGEPGNPFKPTRGPFPTAAHTLSKASQYVAQGAARLGWSLLPNTLALPSRSVDGRPPCQHSGGCVQGCKFGAKSSVDLTALARAERSGNITIVTGARAVRLEVDQHRRVTAVVYVQGDERKQASGDAYVLSGGAIETPRLLLASTSSAFPRGVGNEHDQVGRYLMATLLVSMTVQFDVRLNPYKGPPIDARIWDFARPKSGDRVRSGFVLGVSGTASGYHGPVSYALHTRGIGLAHKKAMREKFGTILQLFAIAEQEPVAENRLMLSKHTDKAGVPYGRVQFSYSQADRYVLVAMFERCGQWADACGAIKILGIRSSVDQPGGAHVVGTCRMGQAPQTSVVDPYGQVHDVDNLYVADASVLPTQGAGDSPSLTIQALAFRTARYIGERLVNGSV